MRAIWCVAAMAACLAASSAYAGGGFGAALQASLPTTLGVVAGNAAANQQDFGKLCEQGQPLPEPYLDMATKSAHDLMAKYVTAAAAGRNRLGMELRDKDEGAHWIGPQGEADLETLNDPYLSDPTHTAPELKQVVVSGDMLTIRSIWDFTVQRPDGATQRIEYGVDALHSYWRGYKIWHVHVYAEPETAPLPAPYCHFVAANSY